MTATKPAPGWEHRVYSEEAEMRGLAYLERVMRGEIRIPGVPALSGFARDYRPASPCRFNITSLAGAIRSEGCRQPSRCAQHARIRPLRFPHRPGTQIALNA